MSASANRQNTGGQPASIQFEKIVAAAKKHLTGGLETLFDSMLDGADDTLFGLAEKADNNQLQQVYFETMRMLRLERTNIKHAFNTQMELSLQSGFQRVEDNNDDPFEDAELSLIDQDSMEEMVAITGMHTKAMQMYKDELLHLGKRLEFIAEHTRNVFPKESVEPKNICEAFRDSVSPVSDQIEIQNKLILYKLFDNKLICNLGDVYRGMNVLLINAGVMPKISVGQLVGRRGSPRRSAPRRDHHPADEYMSSDDYAARLQSFEESNYARYQTANPNALDYQSVQVLSRFLQQTQGGAPISPPRPSDHFSTNDVLNGLSMMQSSADYSDRLSAEQLKNALVQQISTAHGGGITRQVSQLDEKTIDLIQMLFDAMIEDDSVPQPIKSLLLRLQIPVIKSAMLDTDFFTNPHHPSRNLLNGLATSGLQISSEEDEIYPRLASIVDGVVDNYEQDVVCFQQAFDELNTLLHDEEVKAREIESRTQKEALHAHARIIVLQELKNQIRGKNFPQGAHRLVLKHWSTVMYHRYVKYGKNSDQWFESVDTLKEVMASLQSYKPDDSVEELATKFANLTDKLDAELLKTRLDRVAVLDSLDDLREVHTFMLENHRRSQEIEQTISLENLTDGLDEDDFGTGDIEEQLVIESTEMESAPEDVDIHGDSDLLQQSEQTIEAEPSDSLASGEIDQDEGDAELTEDIVELEAIDDDSTIDHFEPEETVELAEPLDSLDEPDADASDEPVELDALAEEVEADTPHAAPADVFPKDTEEFDLSTENAEDIATAMALGLTEVASEVSEQSDTEVHEDSSESVETIELEESGSDFDAAKDENAPADNVTEPVEASPPDDHPEAGEAIPEKFAPKVIGDSQEENANGESIDEISIGGEATDNAQDALLNRLPSDIKPGVWVNLYTGYREPEIRAKLSVIIPETATLIFVDRGGMKAAEKNVDDFASELDEGLSSVVVEHSVFDKALSSVISNLSAY